MPKFRQGNEPPDFCRTAAGSHIATETGQRGGELTRRAVEKAGRITAGSAEE